MGKVCSVPGVGQRTWRKVLKECGEEKRDREGHTLTVKGNKMNKFKLANPYYSETFEEIE